MLDDILSGSRIGVIISYCMSCASCVLPAELRKIVAFEKSDGNFCGRLSRPMATPGLE